MHLIETGWLWAAVLLIPALIALIDGHRDETILAVGMAALSFVGGLIAPALGLSLGLSAWGVCLLAVAKQNARRDRERRRRATLTILKLRVGVSDRAPARARQPAA